MLCLQPHTHLCKQMSITPARAQVRHTRSMLSNALLTSSVKPHVYKTSADLATCPGHACPPVNRMYTLASSPCRPCCTQESKEPSTTVAAYLPGPPFVSCCCTCARECVTGMSDPWTDAWLLSYVAVAPAHKSASQGCLCHILTHGFCGSACIASEAYCCLILER